jgi:hypothetical protein
VEEGILYAGLRTGLNVRTLEVTELEDRLSKREGKTTNEKY